MTIKPWADRLIDNEVKGATVAMLAEIDDLRAELERLKAQEPVGFLLPGGKYCPSQKRANELERITESAMLYLAAGAQSVPEGMQLVPITLTEPMLEKLAYLGRSRVVSGPNKSDWEPAAIRHWKAMMEAAINPDTTMAWHACMRRDIAELVISEDKSGNHSVAWAEFDSEDDNK